MIQGGDRKGLKGSHKGVPQEQDRDYGKIWLCTRKHITTADGQSGHGPSERGRAGNADRDGNSVRGDRVEIASGPEEIGQTTSGGDTLTVVKLDRLGRNALDVLTLIDVLKKREISVRILNLGIDTAGAGGKLFLLLLAGFAEFERNIIRERVLSGLETAKSKGIRLGRKPTLTEEDIAQARRLKAQSLSAREVAKLLHVSKMTAWRAMNS
ncbi:recombinase family protein [Acetobacter thailandicus]